MNVYNHEKGVAVQFHLDIWLKNPASYPMIKDRRMMTTSLSLKDSERPYLSLDKQVFGTQITVEDKSFILKIEDNYLLYSEEAFHEQYPLF